MHSLLHGTNGLAAFIVRSALERGHTGARVQAIDGLIQRLDRVIQELQTPDCAPDEDSDSMEGVDTGADSTSVHGLAKPFELIVDSCDSWHSLLLTGRRCALHTLVTMARTIHTRWQWFTSDVVVPLLLHACGHRRDDTAGRSAAQQPTTAVVLTTVVQVSRAFGRDLSQLASQCLSTYDNVLAPLLTSPHFVPPAVAPTITPAFRHLGASIQRWDSCMVRHGALNVVRLNHVGHVDHDGRGLKLAPLLLTRPIYYQQSPAADSHVTLTDLCCLVRDDDSSLAESLRCMMGAQQCISPGPRPISSERCSVHEVPLTFHGFCSYVSSAEEFAGYLVNHGLAQHVSDAIGNMAIWSCNNRLVEKLQNRLNESICSLLLELGTSSTATRQHSTIGDTAGRTRFLTACHSSPFLATLFTASSACCGNRLNVTTLERTDSGSSDLSHEQWHQSCGDFCESLRAMLQTSLVAFARTVPTPKPSTEDGAGRREREHDHQSSRQSSNVTGGRGSQLHADSRLRESVEPALLAIDALRRLVEEDSAIPTGVRNLSFSACFNVHQSCTGRDRQSEYPNSDDDVDAEMSGLARLLVDIVRVSKTLVHAHSNSAQPDHDQLRPSTICTTTGSIDVDVGLATAASGESNMEVDKVRDDQQPFDCRSVAL